MPILTKEQIWEAIEELSPEDRAEFEQFLPPLELSEEQKAEILAELERVRRDPSLAMPRDEFMAQMRAQG